MQDVEAEKVVVLVGESVLRELWFLWEVWLMCVVGELFVWGIDALQCRRQLGLASRQMSPSCQRWGFEWV